MSRKKKDTKVCSQCGRELPVEAFYYIGYGYYRGTCKECARERTKSYAARGEAKKEPGSMCIRGYARGALHRLYVEAIVKNSPKSHEK